MDADVAGGSPCAGELLERTACFIEAALAIGGCPMSGRAYVRFSCALGQLLVEVTHLGRGTFTAVMGDAAAMPTISIVKKFRKEFEDHLEGRPCPYEKSSVEQLPVLA